LQQPVCRSQQQGRLGIRGFSGGQQRRHLRVSSGRRGQVCVQRGELRGLTIREPTQLLLDPIDLATHVPPPHGVFSRAAPPHTVGTAPPGRVQRDNGPPTSYSWCAPQLTVTSNGWGRGAHPTQCSCRPVST